MKTCSTLWRNQGYFLCKSVYYHNGYSSNILLLYETDRRIRGQESDGGAGEKMERKNKAEVVGQHQERLVGERTVRGGNPRASSMEVSHQKHRPHIKRM